ncbi:unnamed protein product [Nesidiocoris tenuis]|uniref:Uncharacterized protein n=1 Tax=Nesidiocoris tenuis TaxID=355587 RepID=A0A6H5GDG9_9HEMI|nr:unnamed protein product [Nesidiocoris tenuis]
MCPQPSKPNAVVMIAALTSAPELSLEPGQFGNSYRPVCEMEEEKPGSNYGTPKFLLSTSIQHWRNHPYFGSRCTSPAVYLLRLGSIMFHLIVFFMLIKWDLRQIVMNRSTKQLIWFPDRDRPFNFCLQQIRDRVSH